MNRYHKFCESLSGKLEHFSGDRRMGTPKQRKQASSARCEASNIRNALEACERMAEADDNGTLPPFIASNFKSMTSIIDATREKIDSGSGYYSEYFTCPGVYPNNSEEARQLRAWLGVKDNSERDRKLKLEQKLSELRNADIDGFFPTPDDGIDIMLAGLDLSGSVTLEPSAGIGSICDRARDAGADVLAVERNYKLCEVLEMKGHLHHRGDFLDIDPIPRFDYVLMNPPFEHDAGCKHVMHAFNWLKQGGTLRAILPASVVTFGTSQMKRRQEFADFVDFAGGHYVPLPENLFKNSFRSTGVSTVMLHAERCI